MRKIIFVITVLCCLLLRPNSTQAGSYLLEGGLIGMGLGAGVGLGGYTIVEGSDATTQERVVIPIVTGFIGFGVGALVGSTFQWNDYVVVPSVVPDHTGGQIYTLSISGRY